jgi:hypothetical protein
MTAKWLNQRGLLSNRLLERTGDGNAIDNVEIYTPKGSNFDHSESRKKDA